MTFDYKIIPYKNEMLDSPSEIRGFAEKRKTVTRRFKKDRRKMKADRRRSIRDGVIVNLSIKNDRRTGKDRRMAVRSEYRA